MRLPSAISVLALALELVVVPGLWVAHGRGLIPRPGAVRGITGTVWGLVVQYYFRKRPGGEG